MSPMGPPGGKILAIDIVSQNTLITVKIINFDVNNNGSRVLKVPPRGYSLRQSSRYWRALFIVNLRFKIGVKYW